MLGQRCAGWLFVDADAGVLLGCSTARPVSVCRRPLCWISRCRPRWRLTRERHSGWARWLLACLTDWWIPAGAGWQLLQLLLLCCCCGPIMCWHLPLPPPAAMPSFTGCLTTSRQPSTTSPCSLAVSDSSKSGYPAMALCCSSCRCLQAPCMPLTVRPLAAAATACTTHEGSLLCCCLASLPTDADLVYSREVGVDIRLGARPAAGQQLAACLAQSAPTAWPHVRLGPSCRCNSVSALLPVSPLTHPPTPCRPSGAAARCQGARLPQRLLEGECHQGQGRPGECCGEQWAAAPRDRRPALNASNQCSAARG